MERENQISIYRYLGDLPLLQLTRGKAKKRRPHPRIGANAGSFFEQRVFAPKIKRKLTLNVDTFEEGRGRACPRQK
jgi:hypothetical protein